MFITTLDYNGMAHCVAEWHKVERPKQATIKQKTQKYWISQRIWATTMGKLHGVQYALVACVFSRTLRDIAKDRYCWTISSDTEKCLSFVTYVD